jgi:ATP-binding protein involved in chromosome partitioning
MLGIVENMSYLEDPITKVRHFPFGKGGGKGLSEEFGIPFLGEIPLDHMLSSCGDKGDSIFVKEPDGVSANIFEKMQDAIEEQLGLLHTSESLKSFELIWKL